MMKDRINFKARELADDKMIELTLRHRCKVGCKMNNRIGFIGINLANRHDRISCKVG